MATNNITREWHGGQQVLIKEMAQGGGKVIPYINVVT